jgi:hypothetical protein
MGFGNYSQAAHEALVQARAQKSSESVFVQRACHPLMNPKGVTVRECRDSDAHPAATPIVFALDVTGSMGAIPKLLASAELPRFMKILGSCGIDPQLLFLALGDATCDAAPLQVGQFEATAELMDEWLTRSFLEGGGGSNQHESYELGLYFLAEHTETDAFVKRRKKGYVFLTGDELPYEKLSKHVVNQVVGDRLDEDLTVAEVVAELRKTYEPFFLIPDPKRRGPVEETWRGLLGDNVLCMNAPSDTCFVAAGAILLNERLVATLGEAIEKLVSAGLAPDRRGYVAQALTPFAHLHGAAGSWTQRLLDVFK